MLPILRLIPVGGVSLAILLLILALKAPGESHRPLPASLVPARGPLLTRFEHPEWRQMFFHAALRRAEELEVLRLLPDSAPIETPAPDKATTQTGKPARNAAIGPANQDPFDADSVTGSVTPLTDRSIPIDIGESSSTELPVIPKDDQPPVIMTPDRSRPPEQSLHEPSAPTVTVRPDHAGAADTAKPTRPDPLQTPFGSISDKRADDDRATNTTGR